ncbi:hypothetical protein [Burkholderia ambifaria]|jgi:hypothetical protein|uniref:hypothetical protein n=1 Tax=Burkholderia ambifaria TaxID=152480 RepID=UPI00158CD8B4|nr:hypothetical protein [Burkholderia ambifaria]
MLLHPPPRNSIWENDEGTKVFVTDVYDPQSDPDAEPISGMPSTFTVTTVPYEHRNDIDAILRVIDAVQWTSWVKADGLHQTGLNPQDL